MFGVFLYNFLVIDKDYVYFINVCNFQRKIFVFRKFILYICDEF